MFIIFLLLLIASQTAFSMNQEIEAHQKIEIASPKTESEIFYNEIDEFLNFENIDETLENITNVARNLKRSTVSFICGQMPSEWIEVFSGNTNKPEEYKAVGNAITWVSKEEPNKCYYCKKKEITSFEFEKFIELFDISSEDLEKIIVTSGVSYTIWDVKLKKAIGKGIVIPNEPRDKVLSFNSVVFTNYNSFILLRNDGTLHFMSQHRKKSKKDLSCKLKPSPRILNADNNTLIWQDENLNITKAQRFSSKGISTKSYRAEKLPPFTSIILTNNNGWVAQDETGTLYFYIIDNDLNMSLQILRKSGTLLGKSDDNTVVILSEDDTVLKLKNYSSNAKLLNEVTMLKGTKPIPQKPSLKRFAHHWMPIFLLYEDGDSISWHLFKRKSKKTTCKELAFKIMLSKAWEIRNSEALDKLFKHEIFNTFSNYTQQLFKVIYQIQKIEVK